MAPEIISGKGSLSNASDVYSFGILFFELLTGTDAYTMWFADFDKMVVHRNLRPTFPPGIKSGCQELASSCWQKDPEARPSFEAIIATLTQLRSEEDGETAPVELTYVLQANYQPSMNQNDLIVFSSYLRREREEETERAAPAATCPLMPHENDACREFWMRIF